MRPGGHRCWRHSVSSATRCRPSGSTRSSTRPSPSTPSTGTPTGPSPRTRAVRRSTTSDQDEAIVAAFVTGAAGQEQDLTGNVEETLVALKERGLRLGIICDVGLTPSNVLRDYLAAHGVLDLFDHWSFSDEVGCYKPARAIFDHAMAGLGGIDPGRAAHVGDLRRTDIAGARAMGMTAVRYRGANDDPAGTGPEGETLPEGHHVIDDHTELLAVLGI